MKPIDLSHMIIPGMPQWRGDDQPLAIHRFSEHGEGSHMSSGLEFGCHIGTHVDAPLHFLDGAPAVDEMPLDDFSGSALVLDVQDLVSRQIAKEGVPCAVGIEALTGEGLSDIDFVLFHTGWDQHWGTDEYYRVWPCLTADLAAILAGAGLKGIGVDTPSPDPFGGHEAHDLFAAAGMINIENLTNLEMLPRRGAWFQAFPLKLRSTEASPVRAMAWVEPRKGPRVNSE